MSFRLNAATQIALLALTWTAAQAQVTDVQRLTLHLTPAQVKAAPGQMVDVQLAARIEQGWHVNSNTPNEDFLIPSRVSAKAKEIRLASVRYPAAQDITLSFADKPVSVYEGEVLFGLTFAVSETAAPGPHNVEIELEYQACNDRTCMPPISAIAILEVEITAASASKATPDQSSVSGTNTTRDSGGVPGLAVALLFAFLGGLILNLMPCVLPVLSLKIMGMVKQAGEAPHERLKHGLLFTLGVVVSFWVLAGLMILLQAGGAQLGWGFQLQSPPFVIVLSIGLFLFGLSMFGVFEIGTSLTAVGQGAANSSAYTGSFASGVLATTVATPCTAPFMGSALGFTLGAPAHVSLLVFTFVGLGMAAPYLLLTTIPALLKFIPKPGAWMESMKQFMGFLLMATVLWLVWVLGLQTGADGVIVLLGALLCAGIGGWVFGRWGNITKEKLTRRIAQITAFVAIAVAFAFALTNIRAQEPGLAAVHKQGTLEWVTYTPELVRDLRAEGRTVFLDFTAAWCLSCQVNEKVAFGSEEVQQEFARRGVVPVRADWTNRDETIARALAGFGRNSVPLYVLYAPGKEPVLLPEIITPGIVLDALRNSASSKDGPPSDASPARP